MDGIRCRKSGHQWRKDGGKHNHPNASANPFTLGGGGCKGYIARIPCHPSHLPAQTLTTSSFPQRQAYTFFIFVPTAPHVGEWGVLGSANFLFVDCVGTLLEDALLKLS